MTKVMALSHRGWRLPANRHVSLHNRGEICPCLAPLASEIGDDMANALIIFGVSVTLGAMAGFGINLARAIPTAAPVEATHSLNGPRLASLTSHNNGSNISEEAGTDSLADPLAAHDEAEVADEGSADNDVSATSTNEESSEGGSAQIDAADEPPPADDSSEQDSIEPQSAETATTESGSLEPASADSDSNQTDSPEVASTAQER